MRVAAYGVFTDERGLLLAHWNEGQRSGWTLPGGGIRPGEDPAHAVVREVEEETGFIAAVDELLGIDSVVIAAAEHLHPSQGPRHVLRIVYRAHIVSGTLRHELAGSTDCAAWFPLSQVNDLGRVGLVDIGRGFAGLE